MGQKSTVALIDDEVKAELDRMIRDGRATIDEMVHYLEERLGEDAPSRSAVGRYKKNVEEGFEGFRATQDIARVLAKTIEDEPDSPIAALGQQIFGTVCLNTANSMIRSGEQVPADKLMFMGKALESLAKAEKITVDRELKIREKVIREAVEVVEETAKAQGLGEEQVQFWREKVLGIK